MFDLQATDGSVRKRRYKSPIPEGEPVAEQKPRAGNKLDKPAMVALHHRCLDLYTREIDRQRDNRIEQAVEEDFYDNIQWREEDAALLRERGQMPLVYNVISASIDWVTGTEKRARTDFKVLPRRKEQGKPAERKTELLKYLSDVNRTPFHDSRAFEDSTKVGIGWLEDGVQDEDEDEPLYSRYESWRNMLWDSAATEMDLSDARYVIRSKWVDLDVACAMFKKRKTLLERSASDSTDFAILDQYGDEAMDQLENSLDGRTDGSTTSERITGYQRRRVRIIEMWIRMPVEAERLRGGNFSGELYDPLSPGHQEEVDRGEAEPQRKTTMRMHVAIFTSAGMLWFSPSPYRHNRFPFTPVWGYRRGRDGLPYGMVRRVKDIQEDVNKRASKALHILSTNKVIMDQGALPEGMSLEEFQEEVARPDAIIVKTPGKEINLSADRELSQYQLELMSRSIQMIQQAGGVTDENLGRNTNARSGVAIQRRQEQGSLATAKLFDNLRLAKQIRGEKQLANVEQFMSERKAFRITNKRGTPEYVEVNDGLPENDIVRSKADFVISEEDWQSTMRQAAVTSLLEVMSRLPPEVALVLLDLAVENMDLPNRDEIVRRIRSVTGQREPDAEEPTPEEQAQNAAKQEADQLNKVSVEATVKKLLAEAARLQAQAEEIAARTTSIKVDAQVKALTAAREAIAIPASTHVADHILHESGFSSRSELEAAVAGAPQMGLPAPPPNPALAQQPGLAPA